MKKVLQILAACGFGFIMLTGSASAQDLGCYINGTGPGSVNECTNSETLNCQVSNNTIISINNNNVQQTTTGNGEGDDNTSVTYVVTGPATNDNTSAVNGTIVNGNCVPTAVETPGQGSGSTETPVVTAATPQPVVKTLPKTNGTSPAVFAGATVAVLLGAVVASRFGLAAYSKLKG